MGSAAGSLRRAAGPHHREDSGDVLRAMLERWSPPSPFLHPGSTQSHQQTLVLAGPGSGG
jgi:hypothetical protein